jgi:hypothetical protein
MRTDLLALCNELQRQMQQHVFFHLCSPFPLWPKTFPHLPAPRLSHPLFPFLALSYDVLPLQAEGRALLLLPKLLRCLFLRFPASIPYAVNQNLTPGLVRILRELRPGRHSSAEGSNEVLSALDDSLTCLRNLYEEYAERDMATAWEFWRPAINAGLLPVIMDLLTMGHKPLVLSLLRLSGILLMPLPNRAAEPWARGLLRAVAGLISARPPVAPEAAMELLLSVGIIRRDFMMDFHTWGIYDGLQRFAAHTNPRTAAVARALLFLVNSGSDVSSTLSPRIHALHVAFFYVGLPFCDHSLVIPLYCPEGIFLSF